jgi:hypothetical protein
MSQLTTTRTVVVTSTRTVGGLIAIGLLAAALVAVAVMLRPTTGAAVAPKPAAAQVTTRDDFALRQPTAATYADDYGLRHSAPVAIAATSQSDDFAVRHPSVAAGRAQSQRSTDFGLRHSAWQISSQTSTQRDDYGLR